MKTRWAVALMPGGVAGLLLIASSSTVLGRSAVQVSDLPSTSSGSSLYKTYCASCHGVSGKGDGPIAVHLRRPPTDLTRITQQNKGTFPADRLAQIIDGRQVVRAHGDSDMPVWGDALSKSMVGGDEEAVRAKIRELVEYLETLQERTAN